MSPQGDELSAEMHNGELSVLAWPLHQELPTLANPHLSGSAHLPLSALRRVLLFQHQHGKVLGAMGR